MNFNLDTVPKTLDEAVNLILTAITDTEEIEGLKDPIMLHHGFGRWLRNNWSLWEKETVLVQWFVANLGIIHADDISGTILEACAAKLKGEEFDALKHVESYKEHWKRYGMDPATMEKI